MRDPDSQQRLLHLSSSLQSISKCIRASRELLFSPLNTEASTICHGSLVLDAKSPPNIQLNVNLSFSEVFRSSTTAKDTEVRIPGRPNKDGQTKLKSKSKNSNNKQKPFGAFSDGAAGIKNPKVKDKDDDQVFSFGDQDNTINQQTAPNPQNQSKENSTHHKSIQEVDEYWIGSKDDPIKIVEESQDEEDVRFHTPTKQVIREQDEEFEADKISEHSTNHKQPQPQSQAKQEREPNFGSRYYESYYLELGQNAQQKSHQTERFKSIKEKLDRTDQFIKQSMQKHRLLQEADTQTARRSTERSVRAKVKELEIQVTKADPPQQHNPLKLGLMAYFSRSPAAKRGRSPGLICEKYRRELERDRKQRHLAEALKIPFVCEYFTFAELSDFYRSFRATEQPEYRWPEYIIRKIKGPRKFAIFSQLYSKPAPK